MRAISHVDHVVLMSRMISVDGNLFLIIGAATIS
jgi:hypothetical protein